MDTDKDFAVADTTLFIRSGLLAITSYCSPPSESPVYYSELLNIKHLYFGRISSQVLAKQDKYVVHTKFTTFGHKSVCLVDIKKYVRKAQS
jgi:hypothetical protein